MAACPPGAPKGLLYKCIDGLGAVIGTPPETDPYGVPLVQAPLVLCGPDGLPLCAGDAVSGCISDSDGVGTVYGPAPTANSTPGAGPSPIMSRIRANRTGQPVFPYTATAGNKPDQLIDIRTFEGTDVAFNPTTGRFTLPGAVDEEGTHYPEDEDGNLILPGSVAGVQIDATCAAGMVETAPDTWGVQDHWKSGTMAILTGVPVEYGTDCDEDYDAGALAVDETGTFTFNTQVIPLVFTTNGGGAFETLNVVNCDHHVAISGSAAIELSPPEAAHSLGLSVEVSLEGPAGPWHTVYQLTSFKRTDDPFPSMRSAGQPANMILEPGAYTPRVRFRYTRLSGAHAYRIGWYQKAPFEWSMHRVHA